VKSPYGGRSAILPAWREARAEALRRDGWRCTVCGVDISGRGQACVDHIYPLRTHPELALTLANLRSLCVTHDNQGHREKVASDRQPGSNDLLRSAVTPMVCRLTHATRRRS
jgi:5-methylcytosine-specific restriction endonuclease McrA